MSTTASPSHLHERYETFSVNTSQKLRYNSMGVADYNPMVESDIESSNMVGTKAIQIRKLSRIADKIEAAAR